MDRQRDAMATTSRPTRTPCAEQIVCLYLYLYLYLYLDLFSAALEEKEQESQQRLEASEKKRKISRLALRTGSSVEKLIQLQYSIREKERESAVWGVGGILVPWIGIRL